MGVSLAFASLPLPHVGAVIAEMKHSLDELGMAGITVTTNILGKPLADPAFGDLLR